MSSLITIDCLKKSTPDMNSSEEILKASEPKKLNVNAAFIPLLAVPYLILMSLSHDRRITFLVTACLFSGIAFLSHRKKLHVVVQVALLAGAVGACASAWFYGFA